MLSAHEIFAHPTLEYKLVTYLAPLGLLKLCVLSASSFVDFCHSPSGLAAHSDSSDDARKSLL